MDIRTQFPTRFITAGDLNGKSFVLTIKAFTLEEMQSHDNQKVVKPCLWFVGAQRGMVLNRTNSMIVAQLYGYETDLWLGKSVEIYATKVRAFGSMQDALRIRERIPAQAKPVAQAPTVEEVSGLDDDADIADYNEADMNVTLACPVGNPETGEIINGDPTLWEPNAPVSSAPNRLSPAQLTRLHVLGSDVYGKNWPAERPALVGEVSNGACTSTKELSPEQASVLIKMLEAELKHARTNGVPA